MHAQDVPEIKEHPANQYLLGEKQDYETPYYIFKGKNEYPKIIIDACCIIILASKTRCNCPLLNS